MTRVGDCTRPLDLSCRPQAGEQQLVQSLPHACPLPLLESTPACHPGAEPELRRQMRPRDPCVEHKQDPLQCLPIRQPLPTRIAKAALLHWQQRLNQLPQLVRDNPRRDSHRHPFQLDHGCRRHSSSASGSLLHEEGPDVKRAVAWLRAARSLRRRVSAAHFSIAPAAG